MTPSGFFCFECRRHFRLRSEDFRKCYYCGSLRIKAVGR